MLKPQTRKKSISTRLLAKRALKNGPKWKPSKGFKYLKSLKPGTVFKTSSGMKGILIDYTVNARVIVIDVENVHPENKSYYLGRHIIAGQTEVREV